MKKFPLILFAVFTTICTVKAQELESILLAKEDASKLTKAYISPAMKGLIYSMNNGWYHTAKVHKKFGFDITIGANASFAPSKDEIFNLTTLNLSNHTKITNSVTSSSTVAGSKNNSLTELKYETSIKGQKVSANFTLPQGIKEDLPASAIPTPAIQIGVGLPFKLDAIIRYVPQIGSTDVKGNLLGIGIKKEITSLFGPIDKTPLHVSIIAGYTKMTVDYIIGDINQSVKAQNAVAQFELNSYTVQAIASINFPFINFYGGAGYNGGTTKLNMKADSDFIATYQVENYPTISIQENLGKNPISLNQVTKGFNATIGTRLSLGFFKVFASYTLQEYNSVNAGIAFSFR
ncbi:DUF6588 family protein [Tenacibaculum finnmarkense]|uniref:Outer membrane protein beta-barrel domain-containing protein n=1 Tax=Tenacibaculum finnmarkense genomovar ulcerans TaxID=2781388 RepID=A0A2I2M9E8_9FLAO|nr:DUF6588 family protein [Tenacibaculum finnmarkense]ALU75541.1 hypothetical protein AUW17_09820 [Tenacibaculum dicentrarchi]MBE7632949.1 hypothetical protein [Tenacibaculum finnmarkense genomovar ulcerans]MBE7687809.1 hypothetical protein [Tenacibaculum finnmarkense genomovar ulcerans]MBE7697103.1 hypothetical protein [Tenacibaculum finnmarkense genomovar ulcerans]MCD8409761.1 hypothetical protein [Tenacibaculum finnmarkense genomovar ulcerans]